MFFFLISQMGKEPIESIKKREPKCESWLGQPSVK